MRPSGLLAASLIWWALATPSLADEQSGDLPRWIDPEQAANGAIQLRLGDDGRFHGHIEAAALVAAAPEYVWEVLRDCASVPDYVPDVLSCELVETQDDGRAQIFRQEVKFAWFLPRFEHVFRLEYEPYRQIKVHKVSGPLKRLEGSWSLFATADRTLLVYALDLEAGPPLPDFVVGTRLRKNLPEILAAVRERSERKARGQ